MKRKALGKGLRSLIPEAPPRAIESSPPPPVPTADGLRMIDIDRISPNARQPRQDFDQVALVELADSMRAQGVLQPVVVRPRRDGGFELIAGERRWRAAQLAQLLKIPAVVRHVADDKMLELALVENIQREELNPIETAHAYQMLVDELGLTQAEVSERVGKERATIANSLRLLNLQPQVQELIRLGRLTAGHAKPLVAITNRDLQVELALRIEKQGLSVRQAEQLIASRNRKGVGGTSVVTDRDPNVVSAEDRLQSALSTKVRIHQSARGSGRIELHFHSAEELEGIYQVLLRAARSR